MMLGEPLSSGLDEPMIPGVPTRNQGANYGEGWYDSLSFLRLTFV